MTASVPPLNWPLRRKNHPSARRELPPLGAEITLDGRLTSPPSGSDYGRSFTHATRGVRNG